MSTEHLQQISVPALCGYIKKNAVSIRKSTKASRDPWIGSIRICSRAYGISLGSSQTSLFWVRILDAEAFAGSGPGDRELLKCLKKSKDAEVLRSVR